MATPLLARAAHLDINYMKNWLYGNSSSAPNAHVDEIIDKFRRMLDLLDI